MPKKGSNGTKWVYRFGGGAAEGRADMKDLLGGKGANLAEMSSLGLPVPPGFTITTEVCTHFYDNGKTYPAQLETEVTAALAEVEKALGLKFGDRDKPLLVSVRSGATRCSTSASMTTPLPRSPATAATNASPMTATAASCRCTGRSCSASSTTISRS
jgi:pyruvate,orthophosphate dikinase